MEPFKIDPLTQSLYMFVALDPNEGRDEEMENLIKPFEAQGFRFYNTIVFASSAKIEDIKNYISEKKSKKFQFFLVNITDNLDKNTFGGFIHPKYYPIADQAAKIINAYKPVLPHLTDQQRADALYDKIGAHGIDSLSTKEKLFLDEYSKRV